MQSRKNYEKEFGTGRMWPLMIRMAIPSVAAQFVNLLYSIVDRIYIGHISGIGTDALAGVGVCSTLIILIAAFSQIVGGGGTPLAAIALGQGDHERAEEILGNGVTLLALFAVLLTIPAFVFMEPLLRLTGASDATLPYAERYFSVYLTGTFFVMVNVGLNPFINCQGRPGTAMLSVMIGAAINIVLDPILIFGFRMGVTGAAIATVLSQAVSAVWILHFLFSEKASLRIRRKALYLRLDIVGAMTALGISPFVMSSTESLTGIVLNSGLARFGDIYVSALTIMQSAAQFVSVPLQGFTQGCNPVISYNYGQGNRERVREGFRIYVKVMFTYNFLLVLLIILRPAMIARIFTGDTALIRTVQRIMPVFFLGMSIFGMQRACQNMFVSLDEPGLSLFIALLRKVILLIPLAIVLPHYFGYMGIFTAEPIADTVSAVTCMLVFLWRFPKIERRMHPQQ